MYNISKFEDSVEAKEIVNDLRKQVKELDYNTDLRKYLENLEKMVMNLSSLEVDARRTGNARKAIEYAKKLEDSITYFEHLLLMAKLM